MKIAVLIALAAPLASAQTACEVTGKAFTDDKCTTEPEKKEDAESKDGDDKGDDDKDSIKFTGGCEKFDNAKHLGFTNLAKIDMLKMPSHAKATCDGTQITTQFYTDDKCETENADLKKTMKWGDCNTLEILGVKTYFSVSGAMAMKAAAASVLALAASQF